MIIIGLDLSLTSTGVANITSGEIPTVSRIKSEGRKCDSWTKRHHRLVKHAGNVLDQIPAGVDLVVIEAPSYGSMTGSQHDRSGFWWMVYESVSRIFHCQILCVPPTTLKKYATGVGNAPKDKMLAETVRSFLVVPVTGNDEADALQLAALGARYLDIPVDGKKTAVQMSAFDAFVKTIQP